jgi:cell shape-determining protein MreC
MTENELKVERGHQAVLAAENRVRELRNAIKEYGPDERLEAALKEALLKQEQTQKEADQLEAELWPAIREEQIKAILNR